MAYLRAEVTSSRGPRFIMRRAATICTHCDGAIVDISRQTCWTRVAAVKSWVDTFIECSWAERSCPTRRQIRRRWRSWCSTLTSPCWCSSSRSILRIKQDHDHSSTAGWCSNGNGAVDNEELACQDGIDRLPNKASTSVLESFRCGRHNEHQLPMSVMQRRRPFRIQSTTHGAALHGAGLLVVSKQVVYQRVAIEDFGHVFRANDKFQGSPCVDDQGYIAQWHVHWS